MCGNNNNNDNNNKLVLGDKYWSFESSRCTWCVRNRDVDHTHSKHILNVFEFPFGQCYGRTGALAGYF